MSLASARLSLTLWLLRAQAYHTVPDAADLQKVWPHNMHLVGRARNKDIVRLEAWGSVDVAEIERSWVGADGKATRLNTVWLYLEEMQNMELVELSYRESHVRRAVLLVDAGGMSTAHVGLLRYLRTVRSSLFHWRVRLLMWLTQAPLLSHSGATSAMRFTPACCLRSSWPTHRTAVRLAGFSDS